MDFKVCAIFAFVAVLYGCTDAKPVAELQHLPHRPGYVPVYIRLGDTPLDEINAELAEAFREQRGVRPEEAGRALAEASEEHHQSEETSVDEEKSESKADEKESGLSDLDDLGDIGLAEDTKEEHSEESSESKDSSEKHDEAQPPLRLDNVDTASDSSASEESSSAGKSEENSVHIQKIPKNKKQQ